MEEITFRLPPNEAADLRTLAAAASMSTSEYVRFLIGGRRVEFNVGLAALRRLIQMHGMASEARLDGELAAALRELVPVLASAVRHRLV